MNLEAVGKTYTLDGSIEVHTVVVRKLDPEHPFELLPEYHFVGLGTWNPIIDIKLADTDRDGRMEIVADDPLRVYEWHPQLRDFWLQYEDHPHGPNPGAQGEVSIGDFDGDGYIDLSAPSASDIPGEFPKDEVRIVECRGHASYTPIFTRLTYSFESDVSASGDLDGDRIPELVRGGFGERCRYVGLYGSTDNDAFEVLHEFAFYDGGGIGNASFGDTDGDGDDELAISIGNAVHLYEWHGPGDIRRIWEIGPCTGCREGRVYLEDFDRDGKAELFWGSGRGSLQEGKTPGSVEVWRRAE